MFYGWKWFKCIIVREKAFCSIKSGIAVIGNNGVSFVDAAMPVQEFQFPGFFCRWAINLTRKVKQVILFVTELGYCGCYRNYFAQKTDFINKKINAAFEQTDAIRFMRIVFVKLASMLFLFTLLNHQRKYTVTGNRKI